MKIIVQKFGGTSVSSRELRNKVVEKIQDAKLHGYAVVVVVSALGRKGEPYATDSLLQLVEHNSFFESNRECDLLMSCGEIISAVILSAEISSAGLETIVLTGGQAGIYTDNNFGDAKIIKVVPEYIINELQNGKVVIVPGFQGKTEQNEVTTLGRGGSDTSAVALGVALKAELVEIYTDVEGIMTADPKIVTSAKTLDKVTYNEICQLAQEGAKVIHPRAVEIAMQNNIQLRVKCTFSDLPGTLVAHDNVYDKETVIGNYRTITGIAQKINIAQIKIPHQDDIIKQAKAFKALALAGISLDFISICEGKLIFTVATKETAKTVEILHNIDCITEIIPDTSKIALVGAGMTGVPGVMAGIIEALAKEKINVLQTADSYTTIWVLVHRTDMEKAVCALHDYFQLNV